MALLVLSERVSGAPIEVADGSPQTQQAVRLIGWGQDCPQKGCSTAPPRQLKQLDTRVLPAQDCPGIKGGGELCFAGTPTDTACYGDSGDQVPEGSHIGVDHIAVTA
ncbi:trypsin-like serine protease [Streptomyces sp. uw30]|uniref:trypsin-like serine protease n=1 Tax=Streptomyces sp. uw30 TaxID=1828179 RepID=UPI0039678DFC